ncbi:hypothetical protein NM208_g13954 [Fusarium decemcellulare]|uniref:Uncharacterized protein n=1 Tax=Fusarium decemcellulare TaxID=57161 RepID=A0ACC1RJR7_9HYPO|nr:hypothetical protein NM208_g13954 [Fusarium decemcellulare]
MNMIMSIDMSTTLLNLPRCISNMLVVAAPDDSQPATPSAEDHPSHQPWASSDEQTLADSGASQQPSTLTPESSLVKDDDGDSTSPIEALPAASAVDDDDDYSGWMDNDPLEDMEINDPVRPRATQEVK